MLLHSLLPCVLAALTLLPATCAVAEEAIPISQVGAKATASYQGEALGITPSSGGATLRCGFQKLQGRATEQGLWLVSTEPGGSEEFRILAKAVGRGNLKPLPKSGRVTASEKLVQLVRQGLVEEYSVSADGVRQDFIVLLRPDGAGQLRMSLNVDGARAQAAEVGASLILNGSGREIAYTRLHVTDANGRELQAKIEVRGENKLEITVDDTGAAYPLRIDPTFSDADWVGLNADQLGVGVEGVVYAVASDGAGNVYVGGSFTKAGTVDAQNVARWDGARWWPLGEGLDAVVSDIAVMGGEVFASGNTTGVWRWNGATWQAVNNESMGTGLKPMVVRGTDLYVAGSFVSVDGLVVNRVVRWSQSGGWSALGSGLDGPATALTANVAGVQVAGSFTTAGGVPANGVAQWNGTSWSAFGSGLEGLEASVRSLVWHQGQLWAGGDFAFWDLVVWDGTSWGPPPLGWPEIPVFSMASNGNELFVMVKDAVFYPTRVYQYDSDPPPDQEAWTQIGSAFTVPQDVPTKLAIAGNEVIMCGRFISVQNFANGVASTSQPAINVARWNGAEWRALTRWLDGPVHALVVQGDSMWVGGSFHGISGQEANNIAKWNGSSWETFNGGTNGEVLALWVEGNDVYAGGRFSTAGGVPAASIARWNGTTWSALGGGFQGRVRSLAVCQGVVYAGGRLWGAVQSVDSIARFHADTAEWEEIMSGTVNALAVFNGEVIAGGRFTDCLRRWTGAGWLAVGGGCYGEVGALLVHEGSLYVGGKFSRAGSVSAMGIARWDGSAWHAMGNGLPGAVNGGPGGLHGLAAKGSRVYAVCGHASSNLIPVHQWDGKEWTQLGSGLSYVNYVGAVLSSPVRSLAVSPSGSLLVGGLFYQAGTLWSPFLVQANVPGSTLNAQESWRQTHFGSYDNTGDAADAADFDHDGIPNLAEYAFALSPTQPSPAGLPQPQISGSNYVVSFTHPAGLTSVTYGAEWSTTLAADSWQPVTDTGVSPQHVFSVPIGTNTQIFIRLKVTAP